MKPAIPNTAQTAWVELEAGRKRRLPPMGPREELDRLINWYEKNKPDMTKIMPGGVAMPSEELAKFATSIGHGIWMYRGWRLAESDALPRKEKRMKINK